MQNNLTNRVPFTTPPLNGGAGSGANGHGPNPAGVQPPSNSYEELGTPGHEAQGGFVAKAYLADLYWPTVFPLYNRLRRSDPEISIVREIFATVGASITIEFDLPETPSDDDKRFQQFGNEVLDDLQGGIARWRDAYVNYVPFMGWAWWDAVPGLRVTGWRPPDPDDEWRSQYNDGLIGLRRLAFRDHSSFDSWDLTKKTGRLKGMWQNDPPNDRKLLPLGRSLHIVYGDVDNPEGLTPLEAVHRLERIKYGLEVIQGIGYEHAAGYLSVTKTLQGDLTTADKGNIKEAARRILTAQEGNYAAWPYGFTGDVMDVSFSAAGSILSAIQHYSMLKLALFNMQWVAMSTISATGSYAALSDSTALWLLAFNNMLAGAVGQMDEQLGNRLLEMNKGSFPGITTRPKLKASKVAKLINLPELSTFFAALKGLLPLGDDDYLEFRKQSGFLPETLPTAETSNPDKAPATDPNAPPAADPNADPAKPAPNANPGTKPAAPAANPAVPSATGLALAWASQFSKAAAALGGPAQLSTDNQPARLKAVLAYLAQDFSGARSVYSERLYIAFLSYLAQDSGGSREFLSRAKRAVIEAFPPAFYDGYLAGGQGMVDPEDDQWLTAKMNAELANLELTFESLRTFRLDRPAPSELVGEASARSDGYVATLEAVYSEGRLRGAKNKMLTLVGDDGAESCRDCQARKGKRLRARTWVARGWIPGQPGNLNCACRGYRCEHFLITDEGVRWTQ